MISGNLKSAIVDRHSWRVKPYPNLLYICTPNKGNAFKDFESAVPLAIARDYSPAAKLERANELAASALAAYWGYFKSLVSAITSTTSTSSSLPEATIGKPTASTRKVLLECQHVPFITHWTTYNTPEKTNMFPTPKTALQTIGTATSQQVKAWIM